MIVLLAALGGAEAVARPDADRVADRIATIATIATKHRHHHRRAPTRPTKAQIAAAVRKAKRSRNLWATVNVCDTAAHPNVLGIRGQLPALGFPTKMSMLVQVDYYVMADGRFEPDTSVPRVRVPLGKKPEATGLWQGGVEFSFAPPAVLSGTVTFQWKLGGKVIGQVTKLTAHGRKGVKHSDPAGYSTATCTINAP
jgi:hypothetical protein